MFKGTFIAQIIGTIGTFFLAKIYGPEAYGVFGVFASITTVITTVSTLQLEYGIVTSKNDNESSNLTNSLVILILSITLFFFFLYFLFSFFYTSKEYSFNFIGFMILISIFFSFNRVFEAYFTYKRSFNIISNSKILLTSFNVIFQIILYEKFKLRGLIYGNVIAVIIIVFYYIYIYRKKIKLIDFKLLKRSIEKNNKIIKYQLPSSFINIIGNTLLPILIALIFSIKEFGVYFLSLKILSIPLFLITFSVAPVYYEKASKIIHHSKEKLYDLTLKLVKSNTILIMLLLVGVNTIGIYFIELIFDQNWNNLRLYTLLLSFIIISKTAYNPISDIMILLNKNHIGLLLNCYILIINVFALYIGYYYNNMVYLIITMSLFGGVGYFLTLYYFLKKLYDLKK